MTPSVDDVYQDISNYLYSIGHKCQIMEGISKSILFKVDGVGSYWVNSRYAISEKNKQISMGSKLLSAHSFKQIFNTGRRFFTKIVERDFQTLLCTLSFKNGVLVAKFKVESYHYKTLVPIGYIRKLLSGEKVFCFTDESTTAMVRGFLLGDCPKEVIEEYFFEKVTSVQRE